MSLMGEYGVTRQLFSGATSSQASAVIKLPVPCTKFSLQVIAAATSASVNLQGMLASSAGTATVTLMTFSSNSANVLSTASTGPFQWVVSQLVTPGSSGGTSAWFSASP